MKEPMHSDGHYSQTISLVMQVEVAPGRPDMKSSSAFKMTRRIVLMQEEAKSFYSVVATNDKQTDTRAGISHDVIVASCNKC
eukprot:m.250328 g.250328  ORF g.250328 m.250328 type:complete len:82 (+) comp17175_c1_seq7:88-333(+)